MRLELAPDAEIASVLRTALDAGARIVAVNPVKISLEDYFMARLGRRQSRGGPAAGSDTSDGYFTTEVPRR
jgi:hypothetical protein